jgi:hypothetical protein
MSHSRLQTLSEAIEEFAAQSAVEIHCEELRLQNEKLSRKNKELEDSNAVMQIQLGQQM